MSSSSPLAATVTELLQSGGAANRAVLSAGPAWFVVHGQKGGDSLTLEAAASFYLPKEHRPDLAQVTVLRRHGFEGVKERKTLSRRLGPDSAELKGGADLAIALHTLVATLFTEVYAQSPDTPIAVQLSLGEPDPTINEYLVRAIRALAQERSQRNRNRMYQALLGADLLVPMDAEGGMLSFGELTNLPVLGCFTDFEALRYWDPRVVPYKVVPGLQLFPALMQTKLASLLINPSGRLGGELYRNEVEALAAAARERGGR